MTDVDTLDQRSKFLNYSLGIVLVALGGYLLFKAYKTLQGDK